MPNYDDILDQYAKQRELTAAPTPMETTDKYSSILDNIANQRDQKFSISVGNAVKGSPERAAEAQRIAKELNLSPSAVESDFDNALITYKQRMIDKQRAAQDDPILAMQFTDPEFAKIAHDDWWNLSTAGKVMRWFKEIPEDAVKGFKAGQLQYQQGKLAAQEMQAGVVMPDVRSRLKSMDQEMKGLKGTGGFVEEALKVIGQMSGSVPAAAEFGAAAGITAGGVGLAMGPGAPVAAPAAALTAFGAGFTAKMAEEMYGVEGGSAYKEMIDEGVTPETARYIGAGVGVVNSLLEITGMQFVAAPFKKALIKETTQQIAESLAKPTMRVAVQEFAKNYGKAIAGEVSTELLQEMTTIVGGDIANMYDKSAYQSKFLTEEGRAEVVGRLGDVFESTVKAMALLGAPGAAVNFRSDYKLAKEAERQTQFFESLTAAAEASKTRERNPDAFHNLISQQAAATGVENIYVDGERFAQSMIDSGVTVDQLRQVLPKVVDQISEAVRIGEDVVIPTADYATYVAGTKFGQSLLPHVRANIDAISASEAVEFENQKKALLDAAVAKVEEKKLADKAFAESASKVQAQFEQQISGATDIYTPQQAKREAALMSNMYSVMAERLGILPEQAYEMYPITIGREGQAVFSQQADLTTPEFKQWFGDSKVVDAEGKPLRVYHGSVNKGIEVFDTNLVTERSTKGDLPGTYFTTDKQYASGFTRKQGASIREPRGEIVEAYIRINNPLNTTAAIKKYQKQGMSFGDAKRKALEALTPENDGVIFDGDSLNPPEYIVFNSEQIKSVTNERPTNDPNIFKQSARVKTGEAVFKSVIDSMGLSEQQYNSTAIQWMTGLPGDMAFLPPAGGDLSQVVAVLHELRLASGLPPLDISKAEDRKELARLMAAEALAHIRNAGNSLEWYDTTVAKTVAMMSIKYPELNVDRNARNAFLLSTAIASQGMNVEDNLKFAEEQYEAWRDTGLFPVTGKGESAAAMASNFQKANDLIAEMGPDMFAQFLVTPFTVRELETAGFAVGGENKDTMVLGSAIFGPKIGFGFYSNLNGNFEPVTMDMWFMRTVGRLTGTLPAFEPEKFAKQLTRLKDSLKIRGKKEKGIFASQFDKDLVARARTDEGAAIELARLVTKAHEKDYKNNRALFDSGKREKSELVYASAAILQSMDKPRDVPASGSERNNLRDVVAQMVDIVQAEYGQRVPPAALQALIWYPEQELYKAMGVKLRVTSQDYAGAARKLLLAEGIDEQQLDSAAQLGSSLVRQANGGANAGAVQGNGQGVGRAGPLQTNERTQFIIERNRRIIEEQRAAAARVNFEVAPDPNDTELVDLWRALPQEQRLQISLRVAEKILPKVLKQLKVKGEILPQVGSYLDDTNPSFALRIDKGDAAQVSKVLGFVLSQDSMMAIASDEFAGSFKSSALRINIGEKTTEEIGQIYNTLRAIEIDGKQPIGGQSTSGGIMTILLDSDTDVEVISTLANTALNEQYEITIHDVFAAFPEKEEYNYADQKSDPAGDEGVVRQRARDARTQATKLLRSELDAAAQAGTLRQSGTSGGGRLRASDLGEVRSRYGSPRDGSTSVLGVHYSTAGRTNLSGYAYGQGLKGAEAGRLAGADSRLSSRVHFYVDEGAGIQPEAGVGGYVHAVHLDNLYNIDVDPMGIVADARAAGGQDWFNKVEAAIIDQGFDGVYVPAAQGKQGVAVLLGPQHSAVPVEQHGQHASQGAGMYTAPATGQRRYSMLSDEIQQFEQRQEEIQAAAPSARYRGGNLVFDEADLAAIAQFFPGAANAAPLRQAGSTDRGGFNPRDLSITLTKDADYSTLHHETMHAIVEIYARIASQPNAPATIAQDFQTLMDFVGVANVEAWNAMTLEEQRPLHEAMASAHELWFFEGKAPSVELQPVFDRISAWMRKIYNYIATSINDLYKANYGRDLPILNDEVRSVFSRMYASEEQVTQAEQVRNMVPMFQTQEQSGMDDATWQAYQELYQEAHDAAVTDLTKASLRNMRWLSNARSRILKDLQKAADAQRKEVREQVTAEVENEPVYRAMRFLKRGELVLPDGTVQKADGDFKFSIAALEEMYAGEGDKYALLDWSGLGHGKYGMLAKEGLAPDFVATMFEFSSGDALVRALLDAKPINEEIKARTDARMEAEYGDMTDEREIQLKVEEALHNEARARFVAAELRFLNKSTQPVRVMMQAARQAARDILAGKPIKEIRPRDYSLAEARAAKQTEKHMKKGEAALAAKSKQNQLVQNQLAAEAVKARQEVEKGVESFRKFFKSDEKMAKTRNVDLVDAARAILASYGLGQSNKSPTDYIDKLRTYNPDLYAELEPLILEAAAGAKDYTQMTLTEFRLMREAVETLWFQSKREKEVMIEGKALALELVTGELNARLAAIGIPAKVAGEQAAPSKKDRAIRSFYEAKAATRRVEHWANATDGAKGVGPFTTYIWRPIRQALDAYRAMRNVYTKRYVESIAELDLPVAKIEAQEIGYTFGNGNGGIGKAELLGAILHTGNESNYRKLLLGRGWGSLREDGTLDDANWRAFEARMIAEGKLTKADYDWAQSVWDLNEELKPMAQKAHHDLYGYYFKEVESNQVANPLGVWRGGYVPAKTDPFIVRDAQKQAKMEELESDFRNAMPSTGMGFTKARVEYNKPLSLDIRVMAKHIDDVIRFINVQPAVKDVIKILRNREFADNVSRIDPSVIEDMLLPWLNRAARQITSEPGKHKAIDTFWQGVRSRTGISIMFANITNALQQFTGLFPSALKVNGRYLRSALASYVTSPTQSAEQVAELSPFMADRMQNQMIEIQDMMNDLVLNPSKFNKVQKWATHHGYFLQSAFQNMVDTVTWMGAYNQALAELGADVSDEQATKEATQRADAAVRMTQSSLAAEDIAAFEVGTPFYRTFIQFSGYFNMLANLNADEYIKVFRDLGWRGNKGKLGMIYVLGFMMPMILSDAIVRTIGGAWDDEDDDGYLDEFMEWFFGSQLRGAVAMIPGFGPGVAAVFNAFNDKPYDDRMATSPAVSALEGATVGVVKAGINMVDESKQVTGKNVRDVLTLLSLVTGIPLTVLGRPIGYEMEVERGKIQPTGTMDYVRGLITGKASEASKQ